MDSASSIAQRIAGEYHLDTGITFISAMGLKVENTLKRFRFIRCFGCNRLRGYRHRYHRSSGEGQPA